MFTDQRGHAPRGLVGDSKLTLQFLAADAVLGRGEQKICIEPELPRCAALFEERTHHCVNMVAAPLARVSLLRFKTIPFRRTFALGAPVALSEAHVEQVL